MTFEIPAILLLFLETEAHLEMLNLLKQLSFSKKFFTFVSISSPSFKITYLLRLELKIFCSRSCDVIFPPKSVKIEKQKNAIVWNTKFYHPANFELKRIKTAKVVLKWLRLESCLPTVMITAHRPRQNQMLIERSKQTIIGRLHYNRNSN